MPDAVPFSIEPGTFDVSRFFIAPSPSPSPPSSVTQIESVVTGSGYGSVPLLVESDASVPQSTTADAADVSRFVCLLRSSSAFAATEPSAATVEREARNEH